MGVHCRKLVIVCIVGLGVGGCAITPSPLDESTLTMMADDKLARVTAEQEPIGGAIGLYEAMARALKYNLDYRVELYQRSLRIEELNLAHYNLLPGLVANSDFPRRDSFSASTSRIVVDDELGPPGAFQNFNTSQDKQRRTADIELSWHVLDFGLSYVRAKQAADKVLLAEETKRKVANRIIEDVRTAFWRAVTAERLLSRLRRLEGRAARALASSRTVSREAETSPITALTYERELIGIKRTIHELRRDLSIAKTQLAALMNVRPGTPLRLKRPSQRVRSLVLPGKPNDMIWTAMHHRPELREVAYRQRINLREADAALLELLPGLQLYAGANYDSNDFLLNNDWLSWGAKASWNLLRLVQYPARKSVIAATDALLDQRTLAITMAIMTQVHVSRARFFQASRELKTAQDYHDVQRRLVQNLRAEKAGGRTSEQTLLREELNTLLAELRRDLAYSRLQNAYANAFTSIGLDPVGAELDDAQSVSDLAAELKAIWRERGRRGWRPQIINAAVGR